MSLLTRADYSEMLEMFNEKDTFKYIGPLRNKTESEYREYLDAKLEEVQQGKGYYWIVRLADDETFVGAINLNPSRSNNRMQLGFQFKRQFWGQGFAYETAKIALDYGVQIAGLKTIYGFYQKENIASGKILEKLGFVYHESIPAAGEDVILEVVKFTTNENLIDHE